VDSSFGGKEEGGAHLHSGCAERKSCRYTSSIRYAAGRDDRNLHGVNNLGHKRYRAQLRRHVVIQEA
jgi:hypothetical protein